MKKIVLWSSCIMMCTSVMVTYFSVSTSSSSNEVSLTLSDVEAHAYTPGAVENPGPGSERKVMPVVCTNEDGWNVKTGCCPGYEQCSYNVCVGAQLKGC